MLPCDCFVEALSARMLQSHHENDAAIEPGPQQRKYRWITQQSRLASVQQSTKYCSRVRLAVQQQAVGAAGSPSRVTGGPLTKLTACQAKTDLDALLSHHQHQPPHQRLIVILSHTNHQNTPTLPAPKAQRKTTETTKQLTGPSQIPSEIHETKT